MRTGIHPAIQVRGRLSLENALATPADAAQAFVDRVVILSHLPQRIQRRRVAGSWLGFTPRGELGFLSLVTGFPLGPGLDESALLDRCQSGNDTDQEPGEHNFSRKLAADGART